MLRANGIYSARKSPKRLFRIRAVGASYAILTSLNQVIVYVVATAFAMAVLAFVLEVNDRRQDRAGKAATAQS